MPNKSDIIIMAGCSWSAGTWNKGIDAPTDSGLAGHLQGLGYQVRNLAKPGGSNLESIDRIKDWMNCNTQEIKHIKFIIFWQTEFFREIWYYRKSSIWPSLEKELQRGYSQLRDQWVHRPYYRLSEISQKYNLPIYILGGASDTVWYDDFETDFPGVKIICQSVTNLLINANHRIAKPVFCEYLSGWIDEGDFLALVKKNISDSDLQQLLMDIELGEARMRDFAQHKDLFYPDGAHPNKLAHQRIFEWIVTKIPELTNEVA